MGTVYDDNLAGIVDATRVAWASEGLPADALPAYAARYLRLFDYRERLGADAFRAVAQEIVQVALDDRADADCGD